MHKERALKVVLVLVGLFFLAGIYPLTTTLRSAWQANNEDSTPMMLSLYVAWVFLAASSAQAISESQPDRLHCMVELCSRRCYGGDGSPCDERTRRSTDGFRLAWCYRCSPFLAGSGKGITRANLRCGGVGFVQPGTRAPQC